MSKYPDLGQGHVIECSVCGITLMVNKIEGDNVEAEVIDEGK